MAEAGMLTECPSGTPLTKENMCSPVGITNIMIRAQNVNGKNNELTTDIPV